MTADEPVEGRNCPICEGAMPASQASIPILTAHADHPFMSDVGPPMTSPPEPVESREQPRGGPPRNTSQNSPTKETITGNVIETTSTRCLGCGCTPPLHFVGCDKAAWPPRQERQLRADLAAALASSRSLETLRDVHRRTIDDLISEAQTAGATIDELRAEVERLTEANRVAVDYWSFWERTEERTAEHRDHFRADLAAAAAEVSRLREQVEAAMEIEPLTEGPGDDGASLNFMDGYNEARSDFRAILNPEAREGE